MEFNLGINEFCDFAEDRIIFENFTVPEGELGKMNDKLYTDEFYNNSYERNNAVAAEFMPYIIKKLNPKSIVDVGGDWEYF